MRDRPTRSPLLLLLLSVGLACTLGCLSSRPALTPRYFVAPTATTAATSIEATAPEFRLGRVTAAPHLRERLAWRLSDVELAFDEESRWAVPPEEMLREAIERASSRSGRLRESKERGIPQLDVSLENFEGRTENRDALISIRLTWRDGAARSIASRVVRRESPLEEISAESLARALGHALEATAGEVIEWVVSRAEAGVSISEPPRTQKLRN